MKRLPLVAQVLAGVILFALPLVSLQLIRSDEVTASGQLHDAWEAAKREETHRFVADIEIVDAPRVAVINAGRRSRTTRLHLEGEADAGDGKMQMRLWAGPGSATVPESAAEMKVEGTEAYVRDGVSAWQALDGFGGMVAPGGHFLGFIEAARDVATAGTVEHSGAQYQKLTYRVDNDVYARYVRDQLQAAMRAKGELPPNMQLEVPRQYADMTGSGELWVDGRGLPVRHVAHLAFEDLEARHVEADITVDFFDFGADRGEPAIDAVSWLADHAGRLGSLGVLATLLLFGVVLVPNRRSRRIYTAVVFSVIFSMVGGPLVQAATMTRFQGRQAALQAEREQEKEDERLEREMRDALFGPQDETGAPLMTARPGNVDPVAHILGQDAPVTEAEPSAPVSDDEGIATDGAGAAAGDAGATGTGGDGAAADRAARPAPALRAPDLRKRPFDSLGGQWARQPQDALVDALDAMYQQPGAAPLGLQQASEDPLEEDETLDGVDTDDDGLTDKQEALLGLDPNDADTDGDGLEDYVELFGFINPKVTCNPLDPNTPCEYLYTNPLLPDSNNDGLPDGPEWLPADRATLGFKDYLSRTVLQPGNVLLFVPQLDLQPIDTDGDDVPDVLDRDNDGDGVPDQLDTSPQQAYPVGARPDDTSAYTGFSADNRFKLRVDNVGAGNYTEFNFQLRPSNPDRLWYAFTTLNWPEPDGEGQIQDERGRTFYDACIARALADNGSVTDADRLRCADPSQGESSPTNGDTRVVPMLEVQINGSPTNLPLTSTFTTVTVDPFEGSGVNGDVVLTQQGADTALALDLEDSVGGPYTVAVRQNACKSTVVAQVNVAAGATTGVFSGLDLATYADGTHYLSVTRSGESSPVACDRIRQLFFDGDRMIDQELLDQYGVWIKELDDQRLAAYVPLYLDTVEETGERTSFFGKMLYQADGQWPRAHEMHLVWLVQMLQSDQEGNEGETMVHTYVDGSWYMTGFDVREDLGVEAAIVYEDMGPAGGGSPFMQLLAREEERLAGERSWLDRARGAIGGLLDRGAPGAADEQPADGSAAAPSPSDAASRAANAPNAPSGLNAACSTTPPPNNEQPADGSWAFLLDDEPTSIFSLALLTHVLDKTFLVFNDLDGDGDQDMTVDEIERRFNHYTNCSYDANGDGTIDVKDRFDVPNQLAVVTHSYPSRDHALAELASEDTTELLAAAFQPFWTSNNPITPTLMFAQEQSYRMLGLVTPPAATGGGGGTAGVPGSLHASGGVLTVDLGTGTEGVQPQLDPWLKWVPYAFDGFVWEAYDVEEYLDLLGRLYIHANEEVEEVPAGLFSPYMANMVYRQLNRGAGGVPREMGAYEPVSPPSAVALTLDQVDPAKSADGTSLSSDKIKGTITLTNGSSAIGIGSADKALVFARKNENVELSIFQADCAGVEDTFAQGTPAAMASVTVDVPSGTPDGSGNVRGLGTVTAGAFAGQQLIDYYLNGHVVVAHYGDRVEACGSIGAPNIQTGLEGVTTATSSAGYKQGLYINGIVTKGLDLGFKIAGLIMDFNNPKFKDLKSFIGVGVNRWVKTDADLYLSTLFNSDARALELALKDLPEDYLEDIKTGPTGDEDFKFFSVGDITLDDTTIIDSGGKVVDLDDPTGIIRLFEPDFDGDLAYAIDVSPSSAAGKKFAKAYGKASPIIAGVGLALGITSGFLSLFKGDNQDAQTAQDVIDWTGRVIDLASNVIDLVMTVSQMMKVFNAAKSAALAAGNTASTASTAGWNALKSMSSGVNAAAVVGLVIAVVVSIIFFIVAVVKGGLEAFGTAFNFLLAQTIAAIIVAVILFAITLIPVVGQIIAAIVAIIDAIVLLLTFLFTGTATSATAELTKFIAALLFGFSLMVDIEQPDEDASEEEKRTREGPIPRLVDGQDGYRAGNSVTFTGTYTDRVKHKGPGTDAWQANVYLWKWDRDNIKATTIKRTLATTEDTSEPGRNEMTSAWSVEPSHRYIAHQMYKAEATRTETSNAIPFPGAGINREIEIVETYRYALPAIECWTIWIPVFFIWIPIPICYDRTPSGTESTTLDPYYFDVLPQTLDEFYQLEWDDGFTQQLDHDGDGLLARAFGGLDPDDTAGTLVGGIGSGLAWDTDGDRLSDKVEVDLRGRGQPFNPQSIDSDNDGLTDFEEHYLGTLVSSTDTDRDGITDLEEVRGYPQILDAVTRTDPNGDDDPMPELTVNIVSNPWLRDVDLDGIDDKAEKVLGLAEGFHPSVPNESPLEVRSATSSPSGAVKAPGGTTEYLATLEFDLGRPLYTSGNLSVAVPSALSNGPLNGPPLESGAPFTLLARDPFTLTFPLTVANSIVDSYTRTLETTVESFLHDNDFREDYQWLTDTAAVDIGGSAVTGLAETAIDRSPQIWSTRYVWAGLRHDGGTHELLVNEVQDSENLMSGISVAVAADAVGLDLACAGQTATDATVDDTDVCLAVWTQGGEVRGQVIEKNGTTGALSAQGSILSITSGSGTRSQTSVESSELSFTVAWREAVTAVAGYDSGPFVRTARVSDPNSATSGDALMVEATQVRLDVLDGTNGTVYAAITDTVNNHLYIAGNFTEVYDKGRAVAASYLARWNGTQWAAVSSSAPNGVVRALVRDSSGNLYIGGDFTSVGALSADRIAKWNGGSWSYVSGPTAAVSGTNGSVYALEVDGSDNVYAGGSFTAAGDASAARVAKWNGSSWSALDGGVDSTVRALELHGGDIYIGGSFTMADVDGGGSQVTANRVVRWDGSNLKRLGPSAGDNGVNGTVHALHSASNGLLIGGAFTQAGSGTAANRVVRWTGSGWATLGSGIGNGSVRGLVELGGDVVAGGTFTSPGTRLARWNGSTWSGVGAGLGDTVHAVTSFDGTAFAGGAFHGPRGSALARTAAGHSAVQPGVLCSGGCTAPITSVLSYPSRTDRHRPQLAYHNAQYVALWENGGGSEVYGSVLNLNGFVDNLLPVATGLSGAPKPQIAAAEFDAFKSPAGQTFMAVYRPGGTGLDARLLRVETTGEVPFIQSPADALESAAATDHPQVAFDRTDKLSQERYGVSTWAEGAALARDAFGAFGDDLPDALQQADLFPATIADNALACLSALSPENTFGRINAITIKDNGDNYDVFIGGLFDRVFGLPTKNVARWNSDFGWATLAKGIDGEVFALEVVGSGDSFTLYAGGEFSSASGVAASNIVKWNGTSWSALGGGTNGRVYAITADSTSNVYAGGIFDSPASWLAHWDGGSWSSVAGAPTGPVHALDLASATELYVGGGLKNSDGTIRGVAHRSGGTWQPLTATLEGPNAGLAQSTFGLGTDDWTDSGSSTGFGMLEIQPFDGDDDVVAITTTHNGGNPNIAWFEAPSRFEGDQSVAYGGTIELELLQEGAKSCQQGNVANDPVDLIRLTGAGKTVAFQWDSTDGSAETYNPDGSQTPGPGGQGLAGWTDYKIRVLDDATVSANHALASERNGVPLIDTSSNLIGAWTCLSGCSGKASEADLRAALKSVSAFSVRGRFKDASPGGGTGCNNTVYMREAVLNGPHVRAVEVDPDSGDVYAGGNFQRIDGVLSSSIARFDGFDWQPLGVGLDAGGTVYDLGLDPGQTGDTLSTYIGGNFTFIEGRTVNGVARFNGYRWTDVLRGVSNRGLLQPADDVPRTVRALDVAELNAVIEASTGNKADVRAVLTGGNFDTAGPENVFDVARWSGAYWYAVPQLPECLSALVLSDGAAHLDRLLLKQPGPKLGNLGPFTSTHVVIIDGDPPTSTLELDDALHSSLYLVKDSPESPPGSDVESLIIGGEADDEVQGTGVITPGSGIDFVEVQIDGGTWMSATGKASWAFEWTLPLDEGAHTLQSRATDRVGHVEVLTGKPARTVLIDHSAPTLTVASPAAAPTYVKADSIGADEKGPWALPFSGTAVEPPLPADPGAGVRQVIVELFDSQPLGRSGAPMTATLDTATDWSVDYRLPNLDEDGALVADPSGLYTFTVRAIDNVGNLSSVTHTVQVDNRQPEPEVDQQFKSTTIDPLKNITDTNTLITQTLTVSGTLVDPGQFASGFDTSGQLELALSTLDSGSQSATMPGAGDWRPVALPAGAMTDTTWSETLTDTIEGPHQINLRATDDVGNVTGMAGWDVWRGEFDTLAPRVEITQTHKGSGSTARTQYVCTAEDRNLQASTFDCPCAPESTTSVYDDGAGGTTGVGLRLAGLSADCQQPGHDTTPRTASASDAVRTTTVTATIGSMPPGGSPDVFITSPAADAVITTAASLAITGGAYTGGSPDMVVTLDVDGNPLTVSGPPAGSTDGTWSATWAAPTDGVHTLTATMTDNGGAGASAQHVLTFTVDSAAPVIQACSGGSGMLAFFATPDGGPLDGPSAAPAEPVGPVRVSDELDDARGSEVTDAVRPLALTDAGSAGALPDGELDEGAAVDGSTADTERADADVRADPDDDVEPGLVPIEAGSARAVDGLLDDLDRGVIRFLPRVDVNDVPLKRSRSSSVEAPAAPEGSFVSALLQCSTVLTTAHQLQTTTGLGLDISVQDNGALQGVSVRTEDQPELGFVPSTFVTQTGSVSTWRYSWPLDGQPDGVDYDVSVRATDAAGRVAEALSDTATVDIVFPEAITPTLAYTDALAAKQPLDIGDTVTDPVPADLIIEWPASTDGSGIGGYLAGFTDSPDAEPAALTWYAAGAQRHHTQQAGEATRWWGHVIVYDAHGNRTINTVGPIYVDAPQTPDYTLDLGYHGWHVAGCSQIGANHAIEQRADESVALNELQEMFATWDSDALRLTWTGGDWDVDGDLFVYLDVDPATGTQNGFQPQPDAQPIRLPQKVSQTLRADYLVWARGDMTATLHAWTGGGWQSVGAATDLLSDTYRLDTTLSIPHTDLRLPWTMLGVPTGTLATEELGIVAIAATDDATGTLGVWSAIPDKNPLVDDRITRKDVVVSPTQTLPLIQHYRAPSLGADVCPNGGTFRDAQLDVDIVSEPAGLNVDVLRDDLFQHLDPFAPPTLDPLDPDLDGEIELAIPIIQEPELVGPGSVVTYSVGYENRGPETAEAVSVTLASHDPNDDGLQLTGGDTLVLGFGDVAPGARMTTTVTGTVPSNAQSAKASIELDAVAYDGTHGTFEWTRIQHDVDRLPPENVLVFEPRKWISGTDSMTFTMRVKGQAEDRSGVPKVDIVTQKISPTLAAARTTVCLDDEPNDGRWSCLVELEPVPNRGQFTMQVRAYDRFGNATGLLPTTPLTLTVDSEPPTILLSELFKEQMKQTILGIGESRTAIGLALDDVAVDRVELCAKDLADGSCVDADRLFPILPSFKVWQHLIEPSGFYDFLQDSYYVQAIDHVGNRTDPAAKISFQVDVDPPLLKREVVNSCVVTGDRSVMRGTVTDNGGLRVRAVVRAPENHPRGTSFADILPLTSQLNETGEAVWAWNYIMPADVPGSYFVRVVAEDLSSGNATIGDEFEIQVFTDKNDCAVPPPAASPTPTPTATNTPTPTPTPTNTPTPTVTPTPQPEADLSLTMSDAPDPVQAGTDLVYTIDVTNNGPDPSTPTVSGNVPANTTFTALSAPSGWTCSQPAVGGTGAVSCSGGGTLANAASATVKLTVTVGAGTPAGTQIAHSMSVSGSANDPNAANNQAATTTDVFVAPTVVYGDCNNDTLVNAADISALVLELFDGDGSDVANVGGGTYPGGPGCDANDDTVIDAADISCLILIIFNGQGACGT